MSATEKPTRRRQPSSAKPPRAPSSNAARANATGIPSRPGFSNLRPVTSDHVDTIVLDEHEHHHPHEDSDHEHIAEEDERTESQSDRTLQEENSQDDRQQAQKDVEKAEKAPVRQRAKSSSGKPQDPETREWKDDVSMPLLAG